MARLFDWLNDPQRQAKIIGARLNAEFDAFYSVLTGGQFAFPATQNPSADPNTLDDYEEGLWTAAITFTTPGDLSVTYEHQSGKYLKVGRLVSIWFNITTTTFTHATAAGDLVITGLPFTSDEQESGVDQRTGNVEFRGITVAGLTNFILQPIRTTTTIRLIGSGSATASANIGAADMPTGGTVRLRGSATYLAEA